MQSDANLVILGGGCAGLSLGMRLAEDPGLTKKIMILEPRTSYENDRTWCFWKTAPHRYEALITKSWAKMSIGKDQRATIADCSKTPYQMLQAACFYKDAINTIERSPNVKLRLGVRAYNRPFKQGSQWHIETDLGPLTADFVVDTRPDPNSISGNATLWQSFLGHEVECDSARFNPTIVKLMDFLPFFDGNMHFSYVLPLSQTRALIETTVFGPKRLNAEALGKLQADNLKRVCGNVAFKIKRLESGILPMTTLRSDCNVEPGYIRTGLFHGGARPSSGYAFQRIQRWADKCALALSRGQPACGHEADQFTTRAMDGLFLKVLRASPEEGAELFTRLFERVDPARVIRFLSDAGTLSDKIAIISALPSSLFIKQLLSNATPAILKGAAR